MNHQIYDQFHQLVGDVDDPLRAQGRMYPLDEILIITLLATICGATEFVGVSVYDQSNQNNDQRRKRWRIYNLH